MRTARTTIVVLLLTVVGSLVPSANAASDGAREMRGRLDRLGCDAGRASTRDPHTRAAVVRFQAANGLRQSGHLTQRTRKLLTASTQVRCDRRPVPASAAGRRVVVSQHQNYVWLVRANGSVLAQGGMIDNTRELRPGHYKVGSLCGRRAKIRMNTDYSGRLWLPYFTRFANCGVGFHRIPLARSTGHPIHPEWLLGTDARTSSGCLRLSQRLAKRLWTFAGVGTRVVVLR